MCMSESHAVPFITSKCADAPAHVLGHSVALGVGGGVGTGGVGGVGGAGVGPW
jgi:hypothetical protein